MLGYIAPPCFLRTDCDLVTVAVFHQSENILAVQLHLCSGRDSSVAVLYRILAAGLSLRSDFELALASLFRDLKGIPHPHNRLCSARVSLMVAPFRILPARLPLRNGLENLLAPPRHMRKGTLPFQPRCDFQDRGCELVQAEEKVKWGGDGAVSCLVESSNDQL